MRPPRDELEDACARWGFSGAAEEYEVDEKQIMRWMRSFEVEKASARSEPVKVDRRPLEERRRDRIEKLRAGGWALASELAEQLAESTKAVEMAARRREPTTMHGWRVERTSRRVVDAKGYRFYMYRLTQPESLVPFERHATTSWEDRVARADGFRPASEVAEDVGVTTQRVANRVRRGPLVVGSLSWEVERTKERVKPDYQSDPVHYYRARLTLEPTEEQAARANGWRRLSELCDEHPSLGTVDSAGEGATVETDEGEMVLERTEDPINIGRWGVHMYRLTLTGG